MKKIEMFLSDNGKKYKIEEEAKKADYIFKVDKRLRELFGIDEDSDEDSYDIGEIRFILENVDEIRTILNEEMEK